ncbi:nuclear inhibitor of protein phosphatase 1 [Lepeophtheirus salmonis]|uniref:nuclear inhibitor of protein phosphatase 1 n=1 Tax=Lepeophtheirus salmonis TaxID=72036 RepID=UPI001AE7A47B|nr:nuclear inhibitor of protein phosphatase 1-like [Lepeophtheirus salmonis]
MSNHYDIPAWAGKPPTGLHLDVMKETKLIQKLMIDDKKCYLFGRNTQLNDFCIDHQSCSRVHAALVYHKHLQRAFLVDLGSTHGTFVGSVRIEGKKPTQLPVDTRFHFGASTRMYIIRERPQTGSRPIMEEIEKSTADGSGGLLGLPETETELDNLTEFNTAHNRRITVLGIPDESSNTPNKKRKKLRIVFAEDEDVINPEDIDPSVGRFRNLVETTIIPKKKQKFDLGLMGSPVGNRKHTFHTPLTVNKASGLYDGLEGPSHLAGYSATLSYKLGLPLPNPAPDIEIAPTVTEEPIVPQVQPSAPVSFEEEDPDEPKKKKYAKEAWPGRKPTPSLLV